MAFTDVPDIRVHAALQVCVCGGVRGASSE